MPYKMVMREGQHCIVKEDTGEMVKGSCHADKVETQRMMDAMYANEKKELDDYLAEKESPPRTNPGDWAFVPDAKMPSDWKLYIGDARHIGLAIAALHPDSSAPHGKSVDLPSGARAGVIRKIRAAINRLSGEDKKRLMDELNALKSLDDDEVKQIQRPTQAESGYITYSQRTGEACANCRWFDGGQNYCGIIANYPDDILPTGWCERWEQKPAAPGMSMMAGQPMPMMGQGEMEMAASEHEAKKHEHPMPDIGYIAPDSSADSTFKMLVEKFKRGLKPGLSVLKGADGGRYMLIVTSNSYQDREGETITTDALKSYVDTCWARVEDQFASDNKLLYWHDNRVVVGDIVWADMRGPFLVELAKENHEPLSKYLFDYREAHPAEKWAASHRFAYYKAQKDADGVYHRIQKRETSILPREVAANVLTFSGVIPMTSKRDEFLNKMLGLENAAELLDKGIEVLIAELQKQGIEHKATEDKPAESPFTNLLADMIKAQAEMAEELDAAQAKLTAVEGENQALKAANQQAVEANKALSVRVEQTEAALKARPRSASRASETEMDPNALSEDVRKALHKRDPFFNVEVKE